MHHYNTRSRGQPLIPLNLELGKTERENRRSQQNKNMAEQNQNPPRRFGDFYVPEFDNGHIIQEIETENYTIPPPLINMIQNGSTFQGLETEDPNAHVKSFLKLCNTCKLPGISQDKVRRILFPFSLRGHALYWYDAVEGSGINNFEELVKKFTVKYFPPVKMDRLRNEIYQFRQLEQESFSESWERFQELLRKCPNKLVEEEYELQLFYKGLTPESRNIVNASAGGSLNDKTYAAVKELFQRIAENGNIGHSERTQPPRRQACMLQSDTATELSNQMALMMDRMTLMEKHLGEKSSISCEICQGIHHADHCLQVPEPVNFIREQSRPPFQQGWNQQPRPQGMYQQGNAAGWNNQKVWQEPEQRQPWHNQSNQNRRDLPGMNNNAPMQQQARNTFEQVMLEKMDLVLGASQRHDKQFEEHSKRTNLVETSVKNLEVQMGQLAQEIRRRPAGGLPSDTEINPKGKEVRECN